MRPVFLLAPRKAILESIRLKLMIPLELMSSINPWLWSLLLLQAGWKHETLLSPWWTHTTVCMFSLLRFSSELCQFTSKSKHTHYVDFCIFANGMNIILFFPVVFFVFSCPNPAGITSISPNTITAVFCCLRFLPLNTFLDNTSFNVVKFYVVFNSLSLNYWHCCTTLTPMVIKLLDTNYTKSFLLDDFLFYIIKPLFNIRLNAPLIVTRHCRF